MYEYRPLYSDAVLELILGLPKRRQRKLVSLCNQLAKNPFIKADYTIRDADGRDVDHIKVEGFVIAYWVDHAVRKVMVVDIDDIR